MASKLWFVTDGVDALGCFDAKIDVEDHPDEYELAREEGLV